MGVMCELNLKGKIKDEVFYFIFGYIFFEIW